MMTWCLKWLIYDRVYVLKDSWLRKSTRPLVKDNANDNQWEKVADPLNSHGGRVLLFVDTRELILKWLYL